MSDQTHRRRPPLHASASQTETGPKLNIQGRNPDGSLKLKVTLPGIHSSYTLSRGPDVRPLQFEGEIIAEVEKDTADRSGYRNALGPVSYRAAVYRTRGGKFVTEFSSADHTGARTGKADVFGTLDEACDWFRPGPLTTELLKKLGRWGPEIIE